MNDISLIMAFLGGMLYFFSPCILPLIPSFLSFISGISFNDLKEDSGHLRKRVALNTSLFMLGFSIIFISLGLGVSLLGELMLKLKLPIQSIGGVVIILLGLYIIFQNKLKFLPKATNLPKSKPLSIIGIILIGVVFAFSFTACATPYLAAILTVASIEANLLRGFLLLLSFSLGLAVPFLISALSLSWFLLVFNKVKVYMRAVEIVAGSILVFFGGYTLISKL